MDSDLWIQILELVILLALSGFFSSAETAMVSVSKIRLRTLEDEGNKKASLALRILENQSKMLSAILIGNNLVNTSAASIASLIAYSFGGAAVSIATFIITFLILVFGEITPKTWATVNADQLAITYAPIISLLMKVLTPIIWFVNLFSSGILKLMGIQDPNKNISMTESELRTIVDVSHEEGVIEEDEKDMINKVFDLGDAKAKDVMVPRVHVVMAEVDSTYKDLLEIFREEKCTRIPIYQDKIDNILLDCFKIYSPSICTNIYVDSFLSRFINTHSQIDFDIKIDVPDKIKMKPMDLSSLMLCLLQDDMIRKKGTMKFHMYANINELRINIEYPNKINIENDDLQILLKIIVNKYHGEIKIESNQIQCFLFFI